MLFPISLRHTLSSKVKTLVLLSVPHKNEGNNDGLETAALILKVRLFTNSLGHFCADMLGTNPLANDGSVSRRDATIPMILGRAFSIDEGESS